MKLPRDVFIDTIFEQAKKDPSIVFLSADFGAPALDQWRDTLPKQFFHLGISEQNMVDVAAGLALSGKKVYIYAMIPFLTYRCLEQIKISLAATNLPATLVGVGSGFGYDDAGPTHYAVDDIACMRAIAGLEIWSPSDTATVEEVAKLTYQEPALRYVRLDRSFLPDCNSIGPRSSFERGARSLGGDNGDCKTLILSNGYMLKTALSIKNCCVWDIFRIRPISRETIRGLAIIYDRIFVLEEHFQSGGLGTEVLEVLSDMRVGTRVTRIGVPNGYRFENGGRDHLLKLSGLDPESVRRKIYD